MEAEKRDPWNEVAQEGGGGGATAGWTGRCGPGVETLTLFKTKLSDFTIPLRQCEIFRPYLRHLTKIQQRPFADLEFADYFYFICFVLQKPNNNTSKFILFEPLGHVAIPCLGQKLMK